MNILKNFHKQNPDGIIFYADTENALEKQIFENHGINVNRTVLSKVVTVEEFRAKVIKLLMAYIDQPKDKRPKMVLTLDSLGNLSSDKEVTEVEANSGTKDMTRQQKIKEMFRVMTVKHLAKANVPLLVTNHVYEQVGSYIKTKTMSGGSGLKYMASTTCFLTKAKDKEDGETVGNIITVTTQKSRFTKENRQVKVKLSYDKGLDRHHGLIDLAEEYEVLKRVGNKYEFPDGSKHFEKAIYGDPKKFFTQEILDQLNDAAQKHFTYKLEG